MRVEAAAPMVIPSGVGSVVIGPQAMQGNLQIHPGDQLRAGFDFTMPGKHGAATDLFYSGSVSLLVKCADGSKPALTIPLTDQTISDPAGSNAWYPSGDSSSSLVYQGALTAPDLCHGGAMNDGAGALFRTAFFSTDTVDAVSVRFHYSDGATGGWSGTVGAKPAPFGQTVAAAALSPTLNLALSADRGTAGPGDVIHYTAAVTNTPVLSLAGDLYAAATGGSTATVVNYSDDLYTSVDGTTWTHLAVVPLSATPVPALGVSYPAGGDEIVGTQIGPGRAARWHYTAGVPLTATQAAALSDPGIRVRVSFQVAVTPPNPNVVQAATLNLEFSGLLHSGPATPSGIANVAVTIAPPAGAAPLHFDSTSNPALASLAAGASATVSGAFTVPPPPARQAEPDDTSYLAALSALDGSTLATTASAQGEAGSLTVVAPPPAPLSTIELLPVVHILKTGPPSVLAASTELNAIILTNSGGADAQGLQVSDRVDDASTPPVAAVPATLTAGSSAAASAAYFVPSTRPAGSLTDTASVSWTDANNNSYGPISSSFTTRVSGGALFGITGNNNTLSRVDPVGGTLTPVADVSGDNVQLTSIAGDPATHRIFLVKTTVVPTPFGPAQITNEILTLDSRTGQVLRESPPLDRGVGQLAFDPSTGILYAQDLTVLYTIDPETGATAPVATLGTGGGAILSMAVVPGAHKVYVNDNEEDSTGAFHSRILTVDTVTGFVSASPEVVNPVRLIGYDASLGQLVGRTECCPYNIVAIDPSSGNESFIATIAQDSSVLVPFALTVDPATHIAYTSIGTCVNGCFTESDQIVSVDEQTGTVTLSAPGQGVSVLYFEPA